MRYGGLLKNLHSSGELLRKIREMRRISKGHIYLNGKAFSAKDIQLLPFVFIHERVG